MLNVIGRRVVGHFVRVISTWKSTFSWILRPSHELVSTRVVEFWHLEKNRTWTPSGSDSVVNVIFLAIVFRGVKN